MPSGVKPYLRKAILQVVDNQLRDGDPPETKETLNRLLAEGHGREEAMNLLGCVVTAEIFDIMKANKAFDRERFVRALRALPELPWDE